MMDQDYWLIRTMSALDNVYRVVSKYRNARGRQIHQLTNSDRRTLRWLLDRGLWGG